MNKVNLLKETLDILTKHRKTPADVKWVGTQDGRYRATFEEFAAMADKTYQSGLIYGNPSDSDLRVGLDLVVVGRNKEWWLSRHREDDEYIADLDVWVYHECPVAPDPEPLERVFVRRDRYFVSEQGLQEELSK